jgi:periplasmic protein TonB
MKRNNEKIPEFDEIIFENRNKAYGAYILRKNYKSVASFSILAGVALVVILVLSLTVNPEEVTATPRTNQVVIIKTQAYKPDFEIPKPEKAPARIENLIRNLKPVVTDDTSKVTDYIPTVEEIIETNKNPDVNDTGRVYKEITNDVIPFVEEPRVFVEEMPEFPGGAGELLRFVMGNIIYPEDALQNNIQGKVFIKFVVNKDGSVDRIEVTKGVDPALDKEAVRVIGLLPKFNPGKQNGVPVPVWFTIPVAFKIK